MLLRHKRRGEGRQTEFHGGGGTVGAEDGEERPVLRVGLGDGAGVRLECLGPALGRPMGLPCECMDGWEAPNVLDQETKCL